MPVVRYLTHPQVTIDPDIEITHWRLSAQGRDRAAVFAGAPFLENTTRIISSTETKAVECAEIIGKQLGVKVQTYAGLHENDRSGTGYLPADEFEAVADQFFAEPFESVRGWERAIDAQHRIVTAVFQHIDPTISDDILFVGHGAVGTLLWCELAGKGISRAFDQPAGGGNYLAFDARDRTPLHGWRRIEDAASDIG